MESKNKTLKPKKLYRSETDRILSGVCGGLADYFDVDATIVRLVFVLLFVFGGSGLLLYLALWLVVPTHSKVNSKTSPLSDNSQEMAAKAKQVAEEFTHNRKDNSSFGPYALIVIGVLFLLSNFGMLDWFDLEKFWPLGLIVLGFIWLSRNK